MFEEVIACCPQCNFTNEGIATSSKGTEQIDCDDCGAIYEADYRIYVETERTRLLERGTNWDEDE